MSRPTIKKGKQDQDDLNRQIKSDHLNYLSRNSGKTQVIKDSLFNAYFISIDLADYSWSGKIYNVYKKPNVEMELVDGEYVIKADRRKLE